MITNSQAALEFLAKWIAEYIKSIPPKNIVIPIENNVSGILTTLICVEARKQCGCNIFILSGTLDEEIKNKTNNLPISLIELKQELFSDIYQAAVTKANTTNAIITSTLNRNIGIIDRNFKKHIEDIGDIYPLLDFYDSEIETIYRDCFDNDYEMKKDSKMNLLEWADKDNSKTGILSREELPNHHNQWFRYTKEQKIFIATLHQRQKRTNHKSLESKNFPKVRNSGYEWIV